MHVYSRTLILMSIILVNYLDNFPVPKVRLLTGIGRFHEMSYIIRILLKYDEFESLVHTGVEKVSSQESL